jgi:hypothetical protein
VNPAAGDNNTGIVKETITPDVLDTNGLTSEKIKIIR